MDYTRYNDSVLTNQGTEQNHHKHTMNNTMNAEKYGTEEMPAWAVYWLIYGEDDNLSEAEKNDIREWMHSAGIAEVFAPEEGTEEAFTWRPPFGLACNTIACPVRYA